MATWDLQSGTGQWQLQSGTGDWELQSTPPPIFTRLQSITGTNTSGTSIAVTLPAAPTAGNLLVGRVASNDGAFTDPTGWTRAATGYNTTDDDTTGVVYRVAQAGDSATVTFTGFVGNTKLVYVEELYITPGFTVSVDQFGNATESTGVTSKSAGTSGTLANATEYACAVIGIRALTSGNSATAPFSLDAALNNATAFSGNFISQITTATTAVTPTSTWTTAGTAWGCFATFQAVNSGAVAGVAASPSQAEAGSVRVVAGVSQSYAQAGGTQVRIVAGQSAAWPQAAARLVNIVSGAAQSLSQSTGVLATGTDVITTGVSASLSQSASAIVISDIGAAGSLSQAATNTIRSVSGIAAAGQQAAGVVVVLTSGVSQSLSQATGQEPAGTTVTQAGVSASVSQAASGASISLFGTSQSYPQASGSAAILLTGIASSYGQGQAGAVSVTVGEARSYSQAEGAITTGTTVSVAGVSIGLSQAAGAGIEASGERGMGFEMGGENRPVREVVRKPLLQRLMEARSKSSEEIQNPFTRAGKNARKKAKLVEKQAVNAVLSNDEDELFRLLDKWSSYRPVVQSDVLGAVEAYEAFIAQVVAQAQAQLESDDEEIVMALIVSGAI